MGKITPISRPDLIDCLRRLGFEGPFVGGRHQFMVRKQLRLIIPNTHGKDIGIDLLNRILRQANISRAEWENSK